MPRATAKPASDSSTSRGSTGGPVVVVPVGGVVVVVGAGAIRPGIETVVVVASVLDVVVGAAVVGVGLGGGAAVVGGGAVEAVVGAVVLGSVVVVSGDVVEVVEDVGRICALTGCHPRRSAPAVATMRTTARTGVV